MGAVGISASTATSVPRVNAFHEPDGGIVVGDRDGDASLAEAGERRLPRGGALHECAPDCDTSPSLLLHGQLEAVIQQAQSFWLGDRDDDHAAEIVQWAVTLPIDHDPHRVHDRDAFLKRAGAVNNPNAHLRSMVHPGARTSTVRPRFC